MAWFPGHLFFACPLNFHPRLLYSKEKVWAKHGKSIEEAWTKTGKSMEKEWKKRECIFKSYVFIIN